MSNAPPANYTAYGLSIFSEIDLPELQSAPANASQQVGIRLGEVPASLDNPSCQSGMFQVESGLFLLTVEGVARYLVSYGKSIVIQPLPGHDPDSVRLFLFGSVFGALLHQRGLSPLHGSAIDTPQGAIIFAGRSGSGKSALAAALHLRGYPLISDEISALSSLREGVCVLPSIPRLLLWPKVIEALGLQGPHVRTVRPGILKCHIPVNKAFIASPSKIRSVYVLSVTNLSDFSLRRIAGVPKIQELLGIAYRRSILPGFSLGEAHFNQLMALTRQAAIARLGRPRGKKSLSETADLIERDLNGEL
jgi:hypothetical protein